MDVNKLHPEKEWRPYAQYFRIQKVGQLLWSGSELVNEWVSKMNKLAV